MGIRSLSTASISTGTKRSKVWDQSAVVITNSYESIATAVVGAGGTSSVTFSSIPQTYKHLQIRMTTRAGTSGTGSEWILAQLNGDSATNYSWHYMAGNGASSSGSSLTGTGARVGLHWSTTEPANVFHGGIVDILDYTNTSKTKTIRSFSGSDTNSGTYNEIFMLSSNWRSTSAVTSITLTSNWALGQYSHFALYGIKG